MYVSVSANFPRSFVPILLSAVPGEKYIGLKTAFDSFRILKPYPFIGCWEDADEDADELLFVVASSSEHETERVTSIQANITANSEIEIFFMSFP